MNAKRQFRDRIASAVHHAVTTVTEGDGVGHCALYAIAGTMLLRQVTGEPYQPQVGSLMYLADPPGNGWLHIDATDGGLARMEFHVWIGKVGTLVSRGRTPREPDLYRIGELVDFSTRHLRKMTERMILAGEDKIEWTRPHEPPPYVWGGEPPDDFWYEVSAEKTRAFYEHDIMDRVLVERLGRLAISRFHHMV